MAFWVVIVYVSNYFCLFLTICKALASSRPPKEGNKSFHKINKFSLSTESSTCAGDCWSLVLHSAVLLQCYLMSVHVCSAIRHCSTQEDVALYVCFVQRRSLPMNRSIHTALKPTTHTGLAFLQFILSHPAAINRTKSSWWPFLQD